ncbi:MAG: HAD hydrolase family protein [Salibacteraceae bacterium]
MSAIAFVPARAGSKGIKNKNLRDFCGKPLMCWVLEELQKADKIERIVVSTDSPVIEQTVNELGLSKAQVVIRSQEASSDHATTESAMLEFINNGTCNGDDIFVLVQATSPFTRAADFNKAVELIEGGNFDSVLSGVVFKRFLWKRSGQPYNYDYNNRPRRQDFEGDVLENGALYAARVSDVVRWKNRIGGKIGFVIMPEYTGLELDEEVDWFVGAQLMRAYRIEKSPAEIKLFATDVDGVLTDTGMYYSENGDELKKFSTLDGKAFELLRNAGIKTAIITAEDTKLVERRARKLKVDFLYQGVKNKLEVMEEITQKLGIGLHEVAYVGDDLNDLELLRVVGFAACPKNAVDKVQYEVPQIRRLNKAGGEGAVREFADYLLRSRQ